MDRWVGLDQDRARTRIPVGARLRAAEHVHPLGVEELEELARRRVHIDAVLVDGHRTRGIGIEIVEAHAADEDDGVRGREGGVDLQIGRKGCYVPDGLDALGLEQFGVEVHIRRRNDRLEQSTPVARHD